MPQRLQGKPSPGPTSLRDENKKVGKEPAAALKEGRADEKGIEMAGWDIMVEEMCLTSDLSATSSQNNGSLSAIVAAA